MFVSAIETAADHWDRTKAKPVDRLRAAKPELAELLERVGGPGHLSAVADHIVDSLGATKKFIEFILHFLPDPPADRPPPHLQHSWDALDKALRIIYGYRSRALHSGIPFPVPMCFPPLRPDKGVAPSEIPEGLAMRASGGVWTRKDTPMHLHTFEYIVRGALLNWWKSLVEGARAAKQCGEQGRGRVQ